MSALTLIAFLFFLNILQNCLRDQKKDNEPDTKTVVMIDAKLTKHRETMQTRKLLSVENGHKRNEKFVKNFGQDWTNELTQLTNDDLIEQKKKLDKMREFWKFKKLDKEQKKFINNPVLSDIKPKPVKKTEPKFVEFEEPEKKMADFHEFHVENSLLKYERPSRVDLVREDVPTAAPLVAEPETAHGEVEAVSDPYRVNTPRYKRNSEESTDYPAEDLFRPEPDQITSTETTTTRKYHVYTDPSQLHTGIWRTSTTEKPTTSSKKEGLNIDKIYLTTLRPLPGRIFGAPANHRPYYTPPRYSPYRRVSYEPPLTRHEYYPMSVVGQYGGESPAVGLLKLFWGLASSFVKPFVNFSKVGSEVSPCIELLTCEAHRLGNYMGPTAKVLATTLSSVASWMAPESEKTAINDALVAAREDTCMKQIETCDFRSGGKSVLSMVAKMMEQKSKNHL